MKKSFLLTMGIIIVFSYFYTKKDCFFYKTNKIEFDEFYYEDNLLKENDNVEIEYTNVDNKQIANIKSLDTGKNIETITLEKAERIFVDNVDYSSYSSHIHPYVLTRDINHDGLKVRLSVNVDFYSYGSFREVINIYSYDLHILSPIPPYDYENKSLNVWSRKPLPSNEILFKYSTSIRVIDEKNFNNFDYNRLKKFGFSLSSSADGRDIYQRYIENAGKIYIRW